jgi:hypothetical protein
MMLADRVLAAHPLSGTLARAHRISRQLGQFGRIRSNEPPLDPFDDATRREVYDDLMVPHPLAALDRAEVSHKAVMTVAHASQSAISEHCRRMHSQTIPSNLDGAILN